jgi:hypothetical protein
LTHQLCFRVGNLILEKLRFLEEVQIHNRTMYGNALKKTLQLKLLWIEDVPGRQHVINVQCNS